MHMSQSDHSFLMKAAQGGLAEVRLGELAKGKASSDKVKELADQIVKDHTKANDSLKPIAEKHNMPMPTTLDAKHQALYDRLNGLSGAAFDRAYVDEMVKDHQKDVPAFEREAERGADADLKAFAAEYAPALRKHMQMAQETKTALGK
jgi:putative membrane protein